MAIEIRPLGNAIQLIDTYQNYNDYETHLFIEQMRITNMHRTLLLVYHLKNGTQYKDHVGYNNLIKRCLERRKILDETIKDKAFNCCRSVN